MNMELRISEGLMMIQNVKYESAFKRFAASKRASRSSRERNAADFARLPECSIRRLDV